MTGAAVQETGGAIVVCSLTTIFGYRALLTSANQALNSFGLAAVIGEDASWPWCWVCPPCWC